MSSSNSTVDSVGGMGILIPGQSITWAGGGLVPNTFCFGTEDGGFYVTDIKGALVESQAIGLPGLKEPINGIAFTNNTSMPMLAVSTSSEIGFYSYPIIPGGMTQYPSYPVGSHGVVTSPRGGIAAPLGSRGMLLVNVGLDNKAYIQELHPRKDDAYIYKLGSISVLGTGRELFAGAGRRDGILVIEIVNGGAGSRMRPLKARDVDIVDVCSLHNSRHPLAAAGLGIDGSVHFSSDLLTDLKPLTLRSSQVTGRAYAIQCAQGHIFILTSCGLFAWRDLASRFLRNEPLHGPSTVRYIALDPICCSVVHDEWLLVVLPENVVRFAVNEVFPASLQMDALPSAQSIVDLPWNSESSNTYEIMHTKIYEML